MVLNIFCKEEVYSGFGYLFDGVGENNCLDIPRYKLKWV